MSKPVVVNRISVWMHKADRHFRAQARKGLEEFQKFIHSKNTDDATLHGGNASSKNGKLKL